MVSPLFTRYRPPAENDEGIPIVGGDSYGPNDIGANIGYGQNNDDSDDDYTGGSLYGPPSAQAPPSQPSPNAPMTGGAPSVAANPPAPATPAPQSSPYLNGQQLSQDLGFPPTPPSGVNAPPPPSPPAQSPYSPTKAIMEKIQNTPKPEVPKPSIWRQLAAELAGSLVSGVQGNRAQAQPLANTVQQNIEYGPQAVQAQQQYGANMADLQNRLALAEKAEDIETKGEERNTLADTRATNASLRAAQQAAAAQGRVTAGIESQLKLAESAAKIGGQRVAIDAPPTPGTVATIDPMDIDPATGKARNQTRLDIPVTSPTIKVTDPTIAQKLGVSVGDSVPTKEYFDSVGKIIETTGKPPNEQAIKDQQIKADYASALGRAPATVTDAEMNAARRMFGSGQPLTTSMMRDFVSSNKRLPTPQEEQALNLKAEQILHPHQTTDASAIAALDRESKQFDSPWSKMATDAGSQLDKIADARNQLSVGNAETQALAIPKVMTALVSGAGSGVRITQPELQMILSARGIGGDLEGTLRSWMGQGKLTPTQVQQLTGALDDAAKRISQKQAIANEALDNIHSAAHRDDIINADKIARQKMTQYEHPGMVSVQIPGQPPGMIPAANVAAFKAAHPNATVQQ